MCRCAVLRRFLRHHGLTLAMAGFFMVLLAGQYFTDARVHNEERRQEGRPELALSQYFISAHFWEATAENWESEFFQMFVSVTATAFPYQIGSAESKDPRKKHRHRTAGRAAAGPAAPWPVRRGGWWLRWDDNSLALAPLALFLLCFALHLGSGLPLYNEERVVQGRTPVSGAGYFGSARFWFESLQNWQSEFLAIACMVVLTIFLRQKNSPESKAVETPHWKNEE